MKRFLKNKRGAAMESAILFMFVALMLGLLLTGVATHTHLRVKLNDTLLTREFTIEQIGEKFVYGAYAEGENIEIENYIADIKIADNGNRSLTLKNKADKVVLYVEVPQDSNPPTPTTWKYSK